MQTLVTLSIDGAESTDKSIEAATACPKLIQLTISFAERLTFLSIDYLLVSYKNTAAAKGLPEQFFVELL